MVICIGASAYNIEKGSFSHQDRISILEVVNECIKNAKSDEDFKKCEAIEKESEKTQKYGRFDVKKENILSDIEKRLRNYRKDNPKYNKLSGFRDCVVNANNSDELRDCRNGK